MPTAARELISIARLGEIPLMRGLPADLLATLQMHVHECRFDPGAAIANAGDYLDGVYYLCEGHAEARIPAPFPSRSEKRAVRVTGVPIAVAPGEALRLGPGDFIGEAGALTRYPVGVDVTAVDQVSCVLIRTPGLWALLDCDAQAAFKQRFNEQYKRHTLQSHLRRVEVFADVPDATISALIDASELVSFKPNRVIATEGQPCDSFYLVRGGHVKLTVRTAAADVATTYLRAGDWTGEAAVLLDEPWPFTLVAIDHVELVKIRHDDLRRLSAATLADGRLWDVMVSRLELRGRVHDDPRLTRPLRFAVDSGLIHGQSVLVIDLDRCTRCDECVRACADVHDGTPRFVREGAKFANLSVPSACYHCADPVCMIGCPTGAITRPLNSLEVAVDPATCIGCGNCVSRCPWGNILTSPLERAGQTIRLATKCDLCLDRAEGPACVQMCPQGCAERVDFTDDQAVARLLSPR